MENSLFLSTWNDEELGAIYKVKTDGSDLQKLTTKRGIYRTPSYDNTGGKIVYRKEGGNGDQGFDYSKKTGIYIMKFDGSNAKKITDSGEFPMFSTDNKRIFFQTGGSFLGD